jgi:1-acyl-sn-glycerol-3-phosphate acyltransferase
VRAAADAVTTALARLLVRVFFRSLEVSGSDHVPAVGPVIEVANHQNGLVDGLVLIAAGRRYPRFLGKSTLWKIVPLRPFLALAGVVPVYRGADADADAGLSTGERAARNQAALAESGRLLAAGGTIGVFPEGVSHDLASLQELRTGAARLALAAARAGVRDVTVVPVGVVYDDKARFRSRVAVRFGPGRILDGYLNDPSPPHRSPPHRSPSDGSRPDGSRPDGSRPDEEGEGDGGDRAAVRRLTADIGADLRAVGPDFASVEAADRFGRLAAIGADGVSDRDRLARRLETVAATPAGAARIAELEQLALRYRAGLRHLGLDDTGLRLAVGTAPPGSRPGGRADPAAGGGATDPAAPGGATDPAAPGGEAIRTRRRLGPLPDLAAVPVAGVGIAVHAVPYAAIAVLGRMPRNRGMRSTVKLLGSFGLYSLTYLGLGALVTRRRGWAAGLAATLGAPLTGWVALRTLEDADELGALQRAVLVVSRRRLAAQRLVASRDRLVTGLAALAATAPDPAAATDRPGP